MTEPLRLNLGSGLQPLPDYVNVDRCFSGEYRNRGCDIHAGDVYPLPWVLDETVSECRASHVLEHFSHREVPAVLTEWVRVLKAGGVLKIAVPNLEWIAEQYLAGVDAPFQGYLMGGQTDENDYHRSVWDAEMLQEALEAHGLVDVQPWVSEVQDCASLPCSVNLQGTKPGGKPPAEVWRCPRCQGEIRVEAPYAEMYHCPHCGEDSRRLRWRPSPEAVSAPPPVQAPSVPKLPPKSLRLLLSCPRLGFTDNQFCAYEAAVKLGVPLTRNCGVFWHQATENLLEEAAAEGFRYAVVFDYDSVFTPADVAELYRLAEAHPEADAIMALQMRRETDKPLLSVTDDAGKARNRLTVAELQGDLMQAASGHLGLTLFRLASLATLPHPWFQAVPDAEGRWGDGRIDADVALWAAFKREGLRLFLAPRVVIGHLQMLVTWPSASWTPLHQFPSQFVASGRPAGVWR